VSGTVTASRVAEGREETPGATNGDRGPDLVVSVVGSTLAAVAVSGLIMYPFHDRSWAAWAWIGLTMMLGPSFIAVLDRVTR